MAKTIDTLMSDAGFTSNSLPAIGEATPATEIDIVGQLSECMLFLSNEGGFTVSDDPKLYESITHVFPRPEAMKYTRNWWSNSPN